MSASIFVLVIGAFVAPLDAVDHQERFVLDKTIFPEE
jgi:hypothetical protein